MPELILHVGAFKTGTTAIQAFARLNQAKLKAQGLWYPDYPPIFKRKGEAHHDIAHALAGFPKQFGMDTARKLIQYWHKKAAKSGKQVLMSAEAFWSHLDPSVTGNWIDRRRAYLGRVAEAVSLFDVKIVAVLRRQDDYIRSLYQERVMKGHDKGVLHFSMFRKDHINYVRFADNLSFFEEYFSNIEVMLYEELSIDGKLCDRFFNNLGVITTRMEPVGIVRRSLSPTETEIKRLINTRFNQPGGNKVVLAWLRSIPVQKIIMKHFGEGPFDLWENVSARRRYLKSFNAENIVLRDKYFPYLEQLFPPFDETARDAIKPVLSEELLADLIISLMPYYPSK